MIRFMSALLATCCFVMVPAYAQTPTASPAATANSSDQMVSALNARISQDAATNAIRPEDVVAIQGKQKELVERIAKLKSEGTPTPDEQRALMLSIKDQQVRLASYEGAAHPHPKPVDPASLPPATYMTPNGIAVTDPGANFGNGGAVPPPAQSSGQ